MWPELSHQPHGDAVALWIVLGGQVPARADGKLSFDFLLCTVTWDPGDPQVVLSLLQGLQDEELVRGDELHGGKSPANGFGRVQGPLIHILVKEVLNNDAKHSRSIQ